MASPGRKSRRSKSENGALPVKGPEFSIFHLLNHSDRPAVAGRQSVTSYMLQVELPEPELLIGECFIKWVNARTPGRNQSDQICCDNRGGIPHRNARFILPIRRRPASQGPRKHSEALSPPQAPISCLIHVLRGSSREDRDPHHRGRLESTLGSTADL